MIHVSVEDVTGLLEKLAKVAEPDFTEMILDEAEALLLNRIRTRFLAEQDPEGNPWPESRAAQVRRAGGYTWSNGGKWTGTGTLFASGTLFHSIQAFEAGPNSRGIATDVPYALYHNFGTALLPPRVFMGFSEADAKVVERVLAKRIEEYLA